MPPLTAANQLIRSHNVTASEVGALLGEHPYTTPGAIWDRLNRVGWDRNQWPGKEPTLAMRFGSEAEPILRGFARDRLGVVIQMNSKTYTHRTVRLCATPDAMVTSDAAPFGLAGYRDLVEFKLSFSQHRWQHGLPPDIEWQARAQMACAHRPRVIVYAFCGREYIYVVERDYGLEMKLRKAVHRFWMDHMETGIRPDDPVPADIVV